MTTLGEHTVSVSHDLRLRVVSIGTVFAAINARCYREYMARHPESRITLTRSQLEAICRDLADYTDRDADARGWAEQATKTAAENARLRERLAMVAETVALERETLQNSLDVDPWVGYAAPLAAVARIAAALAEETGND
ncbi:MAG: hypothetical protein M3Y58_23615 [Chloroflexota bacterium]|nr:hypothetical protein [Chloroflexota bacterium]